MGWDPTQAEPGRMRGIRRGGLKEEEEILARRASSKLSEGNVKGAVRLLCSSGGVADITVANFDLLQKLHPPAPDDRRSPPSTLPDSFTAEAHMIMTAVRSFPGGSAGGPDGLRPQHLKDLLCGLSGGEIRGEEEESVAEGRMGEAHITSPLLDVITQFVNFLLNGGAGMPRCARKELFGATITGLIKPGGGVRPIAVGSVWRRLAAKVMVQHVSDTAAAWLAPRQLGFGVKGGAEAAAHATRRYLQELSPNSVIAKLDFKNAFNSIRRDVVIDEVQSFFPDMLRFVVACYGEPSHLFFGDHIILSAEGVQQGDPLGPLLFCLAINDLLAAVTSELVIGYLDDITIGGERDKVIGDIKTLQEAAASIGLVLNNAKSEMLGASPDTIAQFRDSSLPFLEVAAGDAVLLGAPLCAEGVSRVLGERREDLELMASRLKYLPAHDTLYLLKNCLAIPKLLYILRASPCYENDELLIYDEALKEALTTLLNIDLGGGRWEQASLPVWAGGLGIRGSGLLAPSAFLSSLQGSELLVGQLLQTAGMGGEDPLRAGALAAWVRAGGGDMVHPPLPATAHKQAAWDRPICEAVVERLTAACAADAADSARMRAVRSQGAGDWLHAIPLTNLGLRLDDAAISVAVGLRLGCPLVHAHTCVCGAAVTIRGHHGLSCAKSAGRQPRHAAANDVIARSLHSAGVMALREPTGLGGGGEAGLNLRPDGVTVLPWSRGRPMVWDFTCPDTLAPSHISITRATGGAAAAVAERNKVTKYTPLALQYEVIPVAVETLGAYGPSAWAFIGTLGARLVRATGDLRAAAHLRQRLSVAVQRGNVAAIKGTTRNISPPQRGDGGDWVPRNYINNNNCYFWYYYFGHLYNNNLFRTFRTFVK